ncbi:hypothetical protein Q1695_005250 [Nippostrongylus brasiliensis]|nr:hypothetical protein Q1695_005250 [Nippostrongylus brasiliensis]
MFIKQWVLNTPILNSRWNRLKKPIQDVKGFIKKQIAERFEAIENGDHVLDSSQPQDYVDAFIAKMRDEEEKGNAETTFDEETLAVNALDLWIAGQETTTTTLSWAMIYLSEHPQVAEKARKEILEVTNGGTRPLSLQDKSRTPYLVATIAEVQRHASILNLNLNRLTATDTEIGGYTVPKGTIVAAQLSLIFADDALFPNPEKFDPDRFMNEESATSNVIAFGMGKRACLGESLARAELYLILGNILLRYSFKAIGGPLQRDPIIKYGVMKKPKRFRMVFTRNQ